MIVSFDDRDRMRCVLFFKIYNFSEIHDKHWWKEQSPGNGNLDIDWSMTCLALRWSDLFAQRCWSRAEGRPARVHREKKFNWIKEMLAYEIFICRQWNNLFDSMISFIWMSTVSMKFGNIESIKILFEPRVCLVKPLNSTSQNNTIT